VLLDLADSPDPLVNQVHLDLLGLWVALDLLDIRELVVNVVPQDLVDLQDRQDLLGHSALLDLEDLKESGDRLEK